MASHGLDTTSSRSSPRLLDARQLNAQHVAFFSFCYYITGHAVLLLGGPRSFLPGPFAGSDQSQTVSHRFHWSSRRGGRACHSTYSPSVLPLPSPWLCLGWLLFRGRLGTVTCMFLRHRSRHVYVPAPYGSSCGNPPLLLIHRPASEAKLACFLPPPFPWPTPRPMRCGSFAGEVFGWGTCVPRVSPFLKRLGRLTCECDPGTQFLCSRWLMEFGKHSFLHMVVTGL